MELKRTGDEYLSNCSIADHASRNFVFTINNLAFYRK